MSTIVAGEFATLENAEVALQALRTAGVEEKDYCTFAVNPPGQHDRFPGGGDRDESPGATHAEEGSAQGAALGIAAGIAVGAIGGPVGAAVGAGVGAYAGSFVGALGAMDGASSTAPQVRQAGVLVAVNSADTKATPEALARLLHEAGGQPVERTEGRWANGEWADFDPLRRLQPLFPVSSKA